METPAGNLRTDVARFLADELDVPFESLSRAGEWAQAGQTIGALGLRLGLLTLDKIDEIVETQQDTRRLFGQIAIDLDILSQAQVERLLLIQEFHAALEVGERLVVNGTLDIPKLLELLTDFFQAGKAR